MLLTNRGVPHACTKQGHEEVVSADSVVDPVHDGSVEECFAYRRDECQKYPHGEERWTLSGQFSYPLYTEKKYGVPSPGPT